MEKIIEKILKKENIEFKTLTKSESGFTNVVYFIDDKMVIKVSTDTKKMQKLKKEKEFYSSVNLNCIAKYVAGGEFDGVFYLIIEKIKGNSVYHVFHLLTEEQRKDVCFQIASILKQINNLDLPFLKTEINWAEKWKRTFKYNKSLLVERGFDMDFIDEYINKFLPVIMKEQKLCVVYNDAHFDNFIYDGKTVKIIDFDRMIYSSVDYELLILDSMLDNPYKFANEEDEKTVKPEDYKNVRGYFKTFYPEMYDFKYIDSRVFAYKFIYKLSAGFEYDRNEWLKNFIEEFKEYLLTDKDIKNIKLMVK